MKDFTKTLFRSLDRVLVLKPVDGKAKSSKGLTDSSLFTGGNVLHAKYNGQTGLWHFEYERGILPPALKQSFTSFKRLFGFAEDYYKRRNIEIIEVRD